MTTPGSEPRLQGLPLAVATLAVALASFMNILDTTIAIVALPTISGNLGATPSQGSWVITVYSVCLAVILPLSGWITRRYGEVRVFSIAILLFSLTSWLCAISTGFNELLLFRALQGFSGGLLLPLSQSLLLRIYPPEKHGLALGIWGITSAVAPVLGPLIGGYITDNFGWPWIFLINTPVGLFCALVCWNLLRRFESETRREPVDFIGLVLLMVGVICFQLVLDRGHELDWLDSTPIIVMLVISVLFFFLFLAWETGEAHPVVDLSLFTHRNFVTGTVLLSVFFICYVLATVIYPIWLQTTMGYTATWAGLVMAPFGLLPIILMPALGQRMRQWDARPTVMFGISVFVLAFYLQAWTSTETTAGFVAAVRLLMGGAMAFVWMPLMVLTLVGLPAEKMASAAGIFNFVRMLASSLGTAFGVTLWDDRTIFHRSRIVESISADSPQYQQAMELLSRQLQDPQAALAAMERAVSIQARTLGLDDIFYLGSAILLPLAFIAWLLPAHGTAAETTP
ncbi:MAG: DHA2 family efflux MFS transporter permease subunit [Gammaproteobacteria bacterium]|nr:DHA2 family efflux MFS transporter permease subunit [Gammaproteobacteria bacterium]